MTDRRGQVDPSSLYDTGIAAPLPLMQPEDGPETSARDAWKAGWRVSNDDWATANATEIMDAYTPIVAALRARTGKSYLLQPVQAGGEFAFPAGGTDVRAVWEDIAAIRQQDPGFLPGAGADIDAFDQQTLKAMHDRRTANQLLLERAHGAAGWAGFAGQLGGSLGDHVNILTLPVGGFGKSVAMRILTEGLANAGVEAIEQPLVAKGRAARGETLTAGEAAANIGMAGLVGSGMQGLFVEPLALAARGRAGWSSLTDAERGSVQMIERDAEIEAGSPFEPGAATEAHVARMGEVMTTLSDPVPGPVPRETNPVPRAAGAPPPPPAKPPPDAGAVFEALVQQESSGRPGIDGPETPYGKAHGMTQVLDSTGEGVANRLGIAWQPELMRGTSEAAIAYQRRIGRGYFEEGLARYHGDMRKALMYYHGGPNERMWGPKTRAYADEVLERVGVAPSPVLSREGFDSDAEWLAAQAAVDAEEALRGSRGSVLGEAPDMGPAALREGEAIDAEPATARSKPEFEMGGGPEDPWRMPKMLVARRRPSDVLEFLADRGGLRDNEGHALTKAGTNARTGRTVKSSRDWGNVYVAPVGKLVRKRGMSIDQAGELLHEAGFFPQRPTTAEVLDMLDRAVEGGEKVYSLHEQADMNERAHKRRQADELNQLSDKLARELEIDPETEADLLDEVVHEVLRGSDPDSALETVILARSQNALDRGLPRAGDVPYEVEYVPGFDHIEPARGDGRALADAGGGQPAGPGAEARGGGAGEAQRPAGSAEGGDPESLKPFDEPAGEGAARQIESLDHDARMALEADPEAMVTLGDGEPRRLADVLKEQDAEAAAIEAAKRCL